MSTEKEVVTIEGMSCNHCVKTVTNALSELDGVTVDGVEIGSARITYDPQQITQKAIDQAIDDLGFEVKGHLPEGEE